MQLEPEAAFLHRLEHPQAIRMPPHGSCTSVNDVLERSLHPLRLRPSLNIKSRQPPESRDRAVALDQNRAKELQRWRRNRLFPMLMAQPQRQKPLPLSNRALGKARRRPDNGTGEIPLTTLRRYSALCSSRTRWMSPNKHGQPTKKHEAISLVARKVQH